MSLYEEMFAAADPSQVPGLSRFFKTGPGQYGEGDKFLGIKVPVTREIVRRCWRELAPFGRKDMGIREPGGQPEPDDYPQTVGTQTVGGLTQRDDPTQLVGINRGFGGPSPSDNLTQSGGTQTVGALAQRDDPTQLVGINRGFGGPSPSDDLAQSGGTSRLCGPSTSDGFSDLEKCITSEFHEVRLAALLTLVEIFKHAKRASRRSTHQADTNICHSERSEESLRVKDSPGTFPCHSDHSGDTLPSEESLRRLCIEFYLSHTHYINNWDLVDLSSYPLLGEWLLDKDRSLLYQLARNGKTIWEQRIGIVSTMAFIRHGQLQDTFAIADILLHHPHDLIHKAVGWLLREAGKRDKAALESWLQESPCRDEGVVAPANGIPKSSDRAEGMELPGKSLAPGPGKSKCPRYRQMPRTMLRYAIEKFPEAERQRYLTGSKVID